MNCESSVENRVLLDLLYPYVFSSQYLVRQAACRSLPALIPIPSIRLHLQLLPEEIHQCLTDNDMNRCCGLLQLMETYIRYLIAGSLAENQALCVSAFRQIQACLLVVPNTLVWDDPSFDE